MATATTMKSRGVLSEFELYTLEEIKDRLDLTESAWRALRDAGLPCVTKGKRKYFLGRKVIAWFDRD